MSLESINNRLKKIESALFNQNNNKWRLNLIFIEHRGNLDNVDEDRKYHLNYEGKELIYDNVEDFYKEYNVYPQKDINPQIVEVIDNSHLEKVLYNARDLGGINNG